MLAYRTSMAFLLEGIRDGGRAEPGASRGFPDLRVPITAFWRDVAGEAVAWIGAAKEGVAFPQSGLRGRLTRLENVDSYTLLIGGSMSWGN